MTNQLDPNHQQTRSRLSGVGLLALVLGAPIALIGFCMFISVFFADDAVHDIDSMGRRAVIGILMTGVGGMATMFGLNLLGFAHMGKIVRYQAGETMPVAKDALRNASPVINEVARGISQSIRGDAPAQSGGQKIRHSCGAYNDPDDKFCKGCGAVLGNPICQKCLAENDPDARFCEKCGAPLPTATQS